MGGGKGDNKCVKFGVDAMLGKIVRVLRFYGFDTEYYRDEKDIEIVAKCLKDGRILITSDRDLVKLAKAWGLKVYFVEYPESDKWYIVKEIIRNLKLKPDPFTRCPKCNGKLKMVSKWDLEGFVHPFVWNKHDEFAVCEECGQIYWEGTHYDKILRNMGE